MHQNYEILIETEEMWAKMLLEVLQEHEIPCAAKSVYGAGLVIRTGLRERLTVYVPAEFYEQAKALSDALFAEVEEPDEDENIEEDTMV